ncbi:MAG: hypothetical protein U0905_11220 [Pirellulales bacterium]
MNRMKLLNCWTKALSVGLIAASGASQVQAQGLSAPGMPSTMGSPVRSAAYAGSPAPAASTAGYLDGSGGYVSLASCDNAGCSNASCDGACGPGGCSGDCGGACGPGGCGGACGSNCGGACGDGCMDCGPGRRLFHFGRGCGPECGQFGMGPCCNDFAEATSSPSCPHCGYAGCPRCGWGLGLLFRGRARNALSHLRPYGEGGLKNQRWFDVVAEATAFERSKGPGIFNFSSQGAGTNNFVLTSDSVDLDRFRAGLSLIGNVQVGPARNVEVVYFGLNKWDVNAAATSTPANSPTLFSFMSAFGTDPINGFDDPDRSFRHSLNYTSRINNGEVNLRSRWVGDYGYFQGSWLAGLRYFDLGERMQFSARGENNDTFASNGPRFFDYATKVTNDLVGVQLGGDLWLNVVPGVNVGVETKGAVMGNHAEVASHINSNSISNLRERASDGRTAYLGQISAMAVYRLSYSWTLRGSYQYIYIDNVALAPENFNATPPAALLQNLPNRGRTLTVNNDGEVAYSGFTVGAEYTW